MLKAVPIELKAANAFVEAFHRHHQPVVRDKYRIGACLDGKLVGVVQVGRPVSRILDDGITSWMWTERDTDSLEIPLLSPAHYG